MDLLHSLGGGGELGQGDLLELQGIPPGLAELGEHNGQGLPQAHDLGLMVPHENVPQLLPGDANAHEAAQNVPVGEVCLAGEGGGHRRQLLLGHVVLRLLPVGEKDTHGALGVLVAPAEPMLGVAAGVQQQLHAGPQGGGEKLGGAGDGPGVAALHLVQNPGQLGALLPVLGEFV